MKCEAIVDSGTSELMLAKNLYADVARSMPPGVIGSGQTSQCIAESQLSALQQGACPKEALDATKRLYLHCAAGIRVHPAKACLEQLGCDDVVALQEGISELYELGFDDLAE